MEKFELNETLLFELNETLLNGLDKHKDNTVFTQDFSLEVNWGFDFSSISDEQRI